MKLKLLVGSMVMMGLVSTCVHADVPKTQANTVAPNAAASTDLVTFWEGIINRNEDNASGVVLNQQNHVSAYLATQASYSAKRGSTTVFNQSPYIDVSPNNKGKTSLSLAAAEVYFDSQVSSWARVHVATAYDSDFTGSDRDSSSFGATDMFFTEAYAELNNFQQGAPVWMYTKIGRQYLNFTSTQYNVISAPLTDALGLTNATAVTVGAIAQNGVYGDFYGYNGSPYGQDNAVTGNMPNTDSRNTIHGWGAEVGYAMTNATQGFNVYADYIENIADTLAFNYNLYSSTGPNAWNAIFPDQQRPGYALHANYNTGPFAVIADYVGMLSSFDESVYTFNDKGANLAAYAIEGDYTLATQNSQTISLGYQGSQDAVQFYAFGASLPMPKSRVVAGYKYALSSNVTLKFEYMYDKDYAASDVATTGALATTFAGSGASNNTVLARMNVTF